MPRGTNAIIMKENNKKLILNLIRDGDFSRADLAKKMRLTKATLSILADELLRDGLIFEEPASEYGGVGRKPINLKIRRGARYAIGIGLSRSDYCTGLFDLGGNPVKLETHKYSPVGAEENLCIMAGIIEDYKALVPDKELLGVGVASPGPLDYKTGTILNPPGFEMWHGCAFGEKLSSLCALPVSLENMANAMALAERYFGCCKTEKNFAYIVVDDGIGSGIVVDDRIYRGQRGCGSEFGHISIAYGGKRCKCGNYGCLERYASIPEILSGTGYSSWHDVVENGDKELIMREAEYLGCGITGLLNLLDLGTIVLGGMISEKGEAITEKIGEIVNSRVLVRHPVRVIVSEIGQKRALAAASAALNRFFY